MNQIDICKMQTKRRKGNGKIMDLKDNLTVLPSMMRFAILELTVALRPSGYLPRIPDSSGEASGYSVKSSGSLSDPTPIPALGPFSVALAATSSLSRFLAPRKAFIVSRGQPPAAWVVATGEYSGALGERATTKRESFDQIREKDWWPQTRPPMQNSSGCRHR